MVNSIFFPSTLVTSAVADTLFLSFFLKYCKLGCKDTNNKVKMSTFAKKMK